LKKINEINENKRKNISNFLNSFKVVEMAVNFSNKITIGLGKGSQIWVGVMPTVRQGLSS
jgi:hypothetical protein